MPAAWGIVLGGLAIWALVRHWGGVTSRSDVYFQYGLDFYAHALVAGLPVVAFTALGVGWVVVLDSSVRRDSATVTFVVAALLASVLLPLLALDHTRTISLTLLPALLAWTVHVRRVSPAAPARLWRRYALAAALIPIPVLVDGVARSIGWQNILYWQSNFP
jgi:hypothetical protein